MYSFCQFSIILQLFIKFIENLLCTNHSVNWCESLFYLWFILSPVFQGCSQHLFYHFKGEVLCATLFTLLIYTYFFSSWIFNYFINKHIVLVPNLCITNYWKLCGLNKHICYFSFWDSGIQAWNSLALCSGSLKSLR